MALAVHCQLNPQVRLFVPTVMAPKLAYRRGKRERGEEPVSKHQIRSGDGRWEERRGMGRLNPRRETKTKGRNGDREREMKEEVTDRIKFLARKRRRRGRAERRLLRQRERKNRARARGREITVATHNVRTMAVDGKHGLGRALDVLSVYDRLGCDVIGLLEARRNGHSVFSQAGYVVYCSGECGDENGGKKRQGGVGLAVRTSITRVLAHRSLSVIACLRLHLNYVVEPKPLRFLSRMLQLRYMMLVRNMHFGRPWTEL